MDLTTNLANWNTLLKRLESEQISKDQIEVIEKFEELFKHLPSQAAVRHQKDLESCTIRTNNLISYVFDNIDCSDRQSLSSFLTMLVSYGYFRLAQITYYTPTQNIELLDQDPIYLPIIEKKKWYDLEPLLPNAGSLGWKGLMNSSLVKEETLLMPACLQLMGLKIHFCSILMNLHHYQHVKAIIKKNGQKVAAKLIELIRDAAHNDENMIGIDSYLFNLLLPFTSEIQLAGLIEAIIQDLFKPLSRQRSFGESEIENLHDLIENTFSLPQHQDLFVAGMIEHLKCNLIRRKRRHSVESAQGNGKITIETVLAEINTTKDHSQNIISRAQGLEITAKSLQTKYLHYWVETLKKHLRFVTLTLESAKKLFGVCCVILMSIADFADKDLIKDLSHLAGRTVDIINQSKYEKFYTAYNPHYLIEFTQVLCEGSGLFNEFEPPIQQLYKSYISKYMRYCVLKPKFAADTFDEFVTFVCDQCPSKQASHTLQYICIRELANCVEIFKSRLGPKITGQFSQWTSSCCKRLHRFIKRNSKLRDNNNGESEDLDTTQDDHKQSKHCIAIHALVCTLRLSIELKNREILELYGDLLLKLFSNLTTRVKRLTEDVKTGEGRSVVPIDIHLSKLINLYIHHRNSISNYLNYDLISITSGSFKIVEDNPTCLEDLTGKKQKYQSLKKKVESLKEMADKSSHLYQDIINQQYSQVTDIAIGSTSDIKREKNCCGDYADQRTILQEVSQLILNNCDTSIHKDVLESTVTSLETCDPLDHPKVLYLLLMLQSLSCKGKQQPSASQVSEVFKEMLPRISCNLVRISKSVELGPSIHAFTRPGSHLSNRSIQCCTYVNCIEIYALLFHRLQSDVTNSFIADSMQIAVGSNLYQYAKHSDYLQKYFLQLAGAIIQLLKSICIGRQEEGALKSSMPIFLSMLTHVIRCIIIASDRKKVHVLTSKQNGSENHQDSPHSEDQEASFITKLELLAIDIGRTLNNLSFLKVKLVEYAPHLISAYVKDSQRASCPESIRLHLNEGVFRIFNLVDAHQKERQEEIIRRGVQRKTVAGKARGSLFDMIHVRLDQASREIFRNLHEEYNRFHRYVGKC